MMARKCSIRYARRITGRKVQDRAIGEGRYLCRKSLVAVVCHTLQPRNGGFQQLEMTKNSACTDGRMQWCMLRSTMDKVRGFWAQGKKYHLCEPKNRGTQKEKKYPCLSDAAKPGPPSLAHRPPFDPTTAVVISSFRPF
jgi:hypothetical protein